MSGRLFARMLARVRTPGKSILITSLLVLVDLGALTSLYDRLAQQATLLWQYFQALVPQPIPSVLLLITNAICLVAVAWRLTGRADKNAKGTRQME